MSNLATNISESFVSSNDFKGSNLSKEDFLKPAEFNEIVENTNIKHEKIKLIRQNLLEPHSNELKLILNEIDFLVHYAWIRPKNPANSITHNTKIIKNIFVNLNKKVKIIFLSSVAGIPESISHYGKSKYKTLGRLYKGIFDIIRVKKIINKRKYE